MAEYFKCGGYDADGYPCLSEKAELLPGPRGERGKKGARGERGPQGEKGEPGRNFPATHLFTLHTEGTRLTATRAGTPVPLPGISACGGFVPNGDRTAFIVPETGVYFLAYHVRTAPGAAVGTRIARNGAPLPGSARSAPVSAPDFSAALIAPLTAGDAIGLQLCGEDAAADLEEGEGASLAAFRLA